MKEIRNQRSYQDSRERTGNFLVTSDSFVIDSNEGAAYKIIIEENLYSNEGIRKFSNIVESGNKKALSQAYKLQVSLFEDGKYPGPIDGILGKTTRKGIAGLLEENWPEVDLQLGQKVKDLVSKVDVEGEIVQKQADYWNEIRLNLISKANIKSIYAENSKQR